MKKLFVSLIIVILLFVSFLTYSETLNITVNNKDHSLIVPDKYADLRTAYIDMAKSYIGSNDDVTKLIGMTDELKLIINDLTKKIDDAIVLLDKKVAVPFWQTMLLLNMSYDLQNQIIIGSIQFEGIIFDRLIIGIQASYPISIGAEIGWKF